MKKKASAMTNDDFVLFIKTQLQNQPFKHSRVV